MDLRGICPYSTSHSTKLSTVSAVMAARTVSTALFLSPRVSRLQVSLDLNILSVAQRIPADADEDEPRAPGSSLHGGAGGAASVADGSELVFPSVRGRALSDATLSKMVRELGTPAVPRGFRSSFRGWAAECSDTPREVCELAPVQVSPDRVEAAYRRTDLFERRRELMEQWGAFLGRS